MTPLVAQEGGTDSGKPRFSADGPSTARTEQNAALDLENKPSKDSKPRAVISARTQPEKAKSQVDDGKLSNKELKDKAKAEKAARRAQEKQKQQGQPVADPKVGNRLDDSKKKEGGRRGSTNTRAAPPTAAGQHKRSGSTSQRSLPIRPVDGQRVTVLPESSREERRVALLDHLYGHPRRTTLMGAGKDVHPAVLTLGLQMSSYVVCGSIARCAATLLVLKQVSVS